MDFSSHPSVQLKSGSNSLMKPMMYYHCITVVPNVPKEPDSERFSLVSVSNTVNDRSMIE